MFTMNQDDISNFILDNLELYIIVTILVIIWVIKSTKKNSPNGAPIRRKKNIDDLIKNDPTLQKLDQEIGDLNRAAAKRLLKDRKSVAMMKANGIDIEDDFIFDKSEVLNDFKNTLFSDKEGFAMPAPDELLDFINERLMWEKRITKSNYSKIESMIEKWESFLNDEYDNFKDPMPYDFENAEEYEKELKKVETKKKNFNSKDTKIRNQILNLLSKALED